MTPENTQPTTPAVELNPTAQGVKDAIDRNSQDSPALSLDPDSSKMSVVGDPNNTQPTTGDYKLTFLYPADSLTSDDKAKMSYHKESDEYSATVTYPHRRVKPLYRMKVTLLVARVLEDLNVINKDGYNTDMITNTAGEILIEHIEDIAEIARMVLGVPRDQMEYMDADGLAAFFNQLMDNEPNLVRESVVFLTQSSLSQTPSGKPTQTTEKADTTQN